MKPTRTDGIDPAARSRSRRRALQAVYAWQISHTPVDQLIAQFAHEQDMDVADLPYFEELVRGVVKGHAELDRLLVAVNTPRRDRCIRHQGLWSALLQRCSQNPRVD